MPEMLSTDPDLSGPPSDEDLLRLQFTTLLYYLHCSNPDNGLVRDKTEETAPQALQRWEWLWPAFPSSSSAASSFGNSRPRLLKKTEISLGVFAGT